MIDYRTDIEPEAKKLGFDLEKEYRITEAFRGDNVFVVFPESPIQKELTKKFDEGFLKLMKSGELLKIYEKWGWDMDFLPYPEVRKNVAR